MFSYVTRCLLIFISRICQTWSKPINHALVEFYHQFSYPQTLPLSLYLFILNSSLESWTCRPTPCCRSSKPINPEAVKYFLAPAPSLEDSKVLLSLHVFLSSLRWFHSINVTKRWRWLRVIMIWKMARIVRWWLCWHVGTFGGEEEWEWSPVDWQNLELALTGVELEYRQ